MKEGLLLTLKELIKLGIIKTKRRKKKRSSQLTTMSSMNKAVNVPLSIQSRRYNEFISASQPPTQMPYTDNLRLRDEQSNFNTRLLEYKNQLENEKSLLENRTKSIADDINVSKTQVERELQRLHNRMNRNADWENDNTDVASTFGSDNFQAQTPMTPVTERNVSFGNIYPSAMQQSDNVSDITNPLPQITNKKSRGRPRSNLSLNTRRKIATQKRKEERIRQEQEKTGLQYEQDLKNIAAEEQYKIRTPYVPIDPDNPPIAFTTKIKDEPFTNEGEVELASVASEPSANYKPKKSKIKIQTLNP